MNKIIYIAGVIVMLFVACSKEPETTLQQTEEGLSILQLNTRSADATDNFESGSTFRMAVYDADSDDTYLESTLEDTYNDVYAVKDDETWKFSFDGTSTGASEQFGFMKEEGKSIDIVAVSPYVYDADLTKLSYTPSTTSSYMWAVDERIDISGDAFEANLNFVPITTALTFKITLKNSTSSVSFTSVTLSVINADGEAQMNRIPYKGTINCRDGSLSPNSYYNSTTNNYTDRVISIGGDWAIRYYYLDDGTVDYYDYYIEKTAYFYPIELADNEKLKIAFTIDNVIIDGTIELDNSDFKDGEMVAGTRYSLDIELDNYLRFDGSITKEDDFTDGETIQTDI
ncbi:MAG: hypothetical protein SNI70_04700 [Rikenellaceae bacterium]